MIEIFLSFHLKKVSKLVERKKKKKSEWSMKEIPKLWDSLMTFLKGRKNKLMKIELLKSKW